LPAGFEDMKRHKSLYPLSHDHHHGLVHARQLSLAGAQAERDSSEATAERFIEFWESDLQRHFQQEEEIVLPLLDQYVTSECAEVRETLRQHTEIRRLIAGLNSEPEKQEVPDLGLLSQIGDALRDHIRFEENELFPILEATVPEKALWQMNEQLTRGRGRRQKQHLRPKANN
jgi:hemerythrin-like domain-containing protein